MSRTKFSSQHPIAVARGSQQGRRDIQPPSRAVINLDNYQENLFRLQDCAPSAKLMAIVKADAYGHGINQLALKAHDIGVQWLGVAQVPEALSLRRYLDGMGVAHDQLHPTPTSALLQGRIYSERPCPAPRSFRPRLFSWIYGPSAVLNEALHADIDLSVSTTAQLTQVTQAADQVGKRARIHIKIDTGLGRGGSTLKDFVRLCTLAHSHERSGLVEVNGLWSHLARADEPTVEGEKATMSQLKLFEEAWQIAWDRGLRPQFRHIAATSGIIWYPEAHFDIVRAGIGSFGLSPNPTVSTSADLGLRPIMRFEAEVTQVKVIEEGSCVSYGGTWKAPTDTWVALIPVGYADGIPRAASNSAPVWVAGRRGRVVGRICMDQLVVALGPTKDANGIDLPAGVSAGDLAVIFGDPADRLAEQAPVLDLKRSAFSHGLSHAEVLRQRAAEAEANGRLRVQDPGFDMLPSVDEWAVAAQTISYEVLSQIGSRVPRVFIQGRKDG
ncbi:MAG: alanine racemase [Actinomycetaceae bacterium]|nr:alanine racemase [Actinomycetaceae bacterium]